MKSDLEWQKWGERDPLFAVATWAGKERTSPAAWTDAEFYQLGAADWADFWRHWQQYGIALECCLEIGCGAGRLTRHLAQVFQRVEATDVSPHQIAYAQARVPANVHFHLSDSVRLPLASQSCSGVFSTHVFQHFDSYADALDVFREAYRVLRPGGSLMVHLPLIDWPVGTQWLRIVHNLRHWLSTQRAAYYRHLLRRGKWRPVMGGLTFERKRLAGDLTAIGFRQIEFRGFSVTSNQAAHEFVLARKAFNES